MTRFAPPRRRVRRRLLDVPVHRGARRVVGKVALALVECDGYFVDMDGFIMCATLYDPHRRHARDPCAWPYPRTRQTWGGLPPHVISVNELDPLRDEGLA